MRFWWWIILAAFVGGCEKPPPLPLAQHVDLNRMYGGWYIIATIPNWFEKGLVAPYDVYSRRPDGDIKETFYKQSGSFAAPRPQYDVHDWVRPHTGNAHWQVQIFWPVNFPFLILYVDPDYRYVMFGEENRTMGWIYARSPEIPDSDYHDLMALFAADGYKVETFRKFLQKPADIGKSGYWSEGITP